MSVPPLKTVDGIGKQTRNIIETTRAFHFQEHKCFICQRNIVARIRYTLQQEFRMNHHLTRVPQLFQMAES